MIDSYPDGPIEYNCGSMVNGRLNGECVTRYRNKDTFSGRWKDGRSPWSSNDGLSGWGDPAGARYQTSEGHLYRGDIDLETGKPCGRVSLVWGWAGQRCGGRYEEFVEDGEPHGTGRYTFAADAHLFGHVYDGPWVDGQKHRTGVLIRLVDKKRFLRTLCAMLSANEGAQEHPETNLSLCDRAQCLCQTSSGLTYGNAGNSIVVTILRRRGKQCSVSSAIATTTNHPPKTAKQLTRTKILSLLATASDVGCAEASVTFRMQFKNVKLLPESRNVAP